MPHPDEGLIHAWLDGELGAAEAARVEALVQSDPAWAQAVAEARGLIAASSRIVGALDHVPANVAPSRPAVEPRRRPAWWTMRVAALLVLAAGTAVVLQRATQEKEGTLLLDSNVAAAPAAREEAVGTAQTTDQKDSRRRGAAGGAVGAGARGAAGDEAFRQRRANSADSVQALGERRADAAGPTLKKLSELVVTGVGSAPPAAPVAPLASVAAKRAGIGADRAGPPAAAPANAVVPQIAGQAAGRTLGLTARVAEEAESRRDAAAKAAAPAMLCYEVREPPDSIRGAPARLVRVNAFAATTEVDSLARTTSDLARTLPPRALSVRGDSLLGRFADGRRFTAVRVTCPRP